jgi:hypothetical protein
MTSKIRAAVFWCGLLICVSSFSLAAIVDANLDTVRSPGSLLSDLFPAISRCRFGRAP